MCVDGAAEIQPFSVPDLRHGFFARDDNFRLARKEVKKLEFLAGHLNGLVIEAHFAGSGVYTYGRCEMVC
jgi:hypothetical protein